MLPVSNWQTWFLISRPCIFLCVIPFLHFPDKLYRQKHYLKIFNLLANEQESQGSVGTQAHRGSVFLGV